MPAFEARKTEAQGSVSGVQNGRSDDVIESSSTRANEKFSLREVEVQRV